MPEMVEVELYRRLAERAVGRTVARVARADDRAARGVGLATLRRALPGHTMAAARRRGKLLLLDTDGPTLGIRFGMTGALTVDHHRALDRLQHGSAGYDDRWVRFRLDFAGGGTLELHDPRRLGRVLLDPDEDALGPDALDVGLAELRRVLGGARGASLKVRLQDQARLAGLGNLLTDEILYRAGLSPLRPAGSLDPEELRRLHRHLRATLRRALEQGGSHTGELMGERRSGGRCPRDGTPLERRRVGGRTSYWCPTHQR